MKLTFTEKEFNKFRFFQDRMAKEFGDTAYVGTDNAVVLVEYSPQLKAMLRPCPPQKQFEYKLSQLSCTNCKRKKMVLSLPDETEYWCGECVVAKRK